MYKLYYTPFHRWKGRFKMHFRQFVSGILLLLIIGGTVNAQTLVQSGFTSVLTPQYMSSGTGTRLPVMFRASVTGLTANTTYRYYNQGATNSTAGGGSVDIGTTNPGAGNPLLINSTGTTFTYTSSPSLTSAGNFQTFTTDGSGNYTGWFGFVNTGNARFTAGNLIYPTIVIGNTAGTVLFRRALDVSITVLAYASSNTSTSGTFLKEVSSSATAKNMAALYDNSNGTGRPLYIAPVESIGATIASTTPGYSTTAGSWNAIIPNNNANGVQRIEQRSVVDGTVTGCATDADGIWPTGSINTANPAAGAAGLTIAAVDAPLSSCIVCNIITVSANALAIECPGNATTVTVSATGGVAPYTGTGTFTVSAGTYTYNVTDANGCTGTTTITIAAATDLINPSIYLQGSKLLTGITGSSSSQSPYLKPFKPGIQFKSIITAGDTIGGYKMAGIPDGLGAFDNGDGTFTLLMNHEIGNTLGVVRAHGSKGAFVSKWIINKSNLAVVSGSDLMQQAYLWDTTTHSYNLAAPGAAAFSRFCSADLPAISAFYNNATGLGTMERIFMDGEESGVEGRAMGHIVTGTNAGKSYELPYLGKFAWENAVASPAAGDKTVVAGMDDGTGGQVYFYIGTKTNSGTEIEKAGLQNGKLFGVKVDGLATEVSSGTPAPGTAFTLVDLGFVQNKTGLTINNESVAAGVTTFLRPEDGAWDPSNPNDFYFATTNAFGAATPTRLWRLRFTNVTTPELGGTIEAVLNGTELDQRMFDNISIDKKGHIFLLEDVGNNAHIGKVFQYNIASDSLFAIAYNDSTRFISGAPNFLTQDEESSGVIDASDILGQGMSLIVTQSHNGSADPELVEGGQLMAFYNPYVFGTSTAADTVRSAAGCNASVDLGIPSTADNCTVASVTNNAPATFSLGTTTITWTVTDASGNTATAEQTVIITDSTAPSITAPANINAGSNSGCSAAGINLGSPIVSDNCAVDSITNDAPSSFPVGTTTVTWTVKDSSGNSATATQLVTVVDTLKPVVYLQQGSLLTGITGSSSSQSPYLKPFKPGIQFKSILTVGDAIGGYKLAGLPDGLGAFDNNNGTFTLLVNHEIGNTLGVTRAHGSKGSFVSKWIINKNDLSVVSGQDLMQQVYLWDTTTHSFNLGTVAFSRFCSADLPEPAAFFNSATGKGTTERIFMNGEESGVEGKAMGHIVTGAAAGKSYELPYLGKFAWENSVANPASGDKTVVAGMDDGTGGQVYVYVGSKTTSGTDIDKAGLNNGKLYGIKVTGFTAETSASIPAAGTRFEMADLGFVQNKTGATLNSESIAAGVTTFLRPEDGAWDPSHPNDLYFNTTNAFNSPTRVWRARFDDIKNPELGGTIEAVVNGTEAGQQMFDNMSIDRRGHLILQEDVGNNVHLGKVWQYNIATDSLFAIAYHDSTRFITGAPNFLTQDEESSGVIDVSDILGEGMHITTVQSHNGSPDPELVEGGQLLVFFNPYTLNSGTAKDTVKVTVPFGTTSATVDLGIPATADNCSIASVTSDAPATFPVGTTDVTWTATDASGNSNSIIQKVVVAASGNGAPTVTITSPPNPATFNAGSNINIQVSATDNDGGVKKVELYVNGSLFATDSVAPYTFGGSGVEEGVYKVTAQATDIFDASTSTDTLTITVKGCKASGSINAEGFLNIPGSQVADLMASPKFPNNPDVTAQLTTLEYSNVGDNYGGRLIGYICAPLTGDYTFYISGNDQAGLWLSTDATAANKVLIAYAESATNFRDYYKFATQQSVKIHLVKGARYYIETLQKEATGQDHLSVAWRLPNGTFEAPIPASRISPFGSLFGRPAFVEAMRIAPATVNGAKELSVTVQPNPSHSDFTLITRSNSDEKITIRVLDAQARVIETVISANANGTIKLGRKLTPGIYFAEVIQGKQLKMVKMVKE